MSRQQVISAVVTGLAFASVAALLTALPDCPPTAGFYDDPDGLCDAGSVDWGTVAAAAVLGSALGAVGSALRRRRRRQLGYE